MIDVLLSVGFYFPQYSLWHGPTTCNTVSYPNHKENIRSQGLLDPTRVRQQALLGTPVPWGAEHQPSWFGCLRLQKSSHRCWGLRPLGKDELSPTVPMRVLTSPSWVVIELLPTMGGVTCFTVLVTLPLPPLDSFTRVAVGLLNSLWLNRNVSHGGAGHHINI